jgi:hypothetical protein
VLRLRERSVRPGLRARTDLRAPSHLVPRPGSSFLTPWRTAKATFTTPPDRLVRPQLAVVSCIRRNVSDSRLDRGAAASHLRGDHEPLVDHAVAALARSGQVTRTSRRVGMREAPTELAVRHEGHVPEIEGMLGCHADESRRRVVEGGTKADLPAVEVWPEILGDLPSRECRSNGCTTARPTTVIARTSPVSRSQVSIVNATLGSVESHSPSREYEEPVSHQNVRPS